LCLLTSAAETVSSSLDAASSGVVFVELCLLTSVDDD